MFVEKAANWQLALPAALTLALAFLAGGFFAGTVGLTAGLLCLLLVARLTLAERPFAGWSASLAVTTGVLALFCAWTLASVRLVERARPGDWSSSIAPCCTSSSSRSWACTRARSGHLRGAPALGRPRDRAHAPRSRSPRGCFRRSSRPSGGVNTDRLAFPLTYWNALGIFCGLGAILLTHLTASEREPAAVRVAAAAGLPIVDGGALLHVLARRASPPRSSASSSTSCSRIHAGSSVRCPLSACRSPSPSNAPTDRSCSRASSMPDPTRASRAGRWLVVVIGCVVAAAVLRMLALRADRRMLEIRIGPRTRRRLFGAAGIAALVALAVATVAFDLPGRIDEQRKAFVRGDEPPGGNDLRTRLTDVGNNGRREQWNIALDTGAISPWRGVGAGTYRLYWERDRPPPPAKVVDAHSLVLETRAELGWIGLVSARDRARRPARGRGRAPPWPGTPRLRRLPGRRDRTAAARAGRLGLGDAGALHLVLRRGRDHPRDDDGARCRAACAAAADPAAWPGSRACSSR